MVKNTGITKSGLKYIKKMIDGAIDEEEPLHRYAKSILGNFQSIDLPIADEMGSTQTFAYQKWDVVTATPKRIHLQEIPIALALQGANPEQIIVAEARNILPDGGNKFGSASAIGIARISEEIEIEAMKIKFDFRLKPATTDATSLARGPNYDVVIEYKIVSIDPEKLQWQGSQGSQIDPVKISDVFPGLSQNGGITVYMKDQKPKHDYTIVRSKTIILNSAAGLLDEKPNNNGYHIVTTQVSRKSCVETFKYGKGRKKTYPWEITVVAGNGTMTKSPNNDGIYQDGKNLYLYYRAYYLDQQYNGNTFVPLGTGENPSPVQARITSIIYYRDGTPYTNDQAIANVVN